nr:hypothetical protein [Tanacetum cinerariifolium]
MPNPEDITDPTTAMNMTLALMAKAFKLNYSTPTNKNQRISSNPRNRQIAQPGMNIGQDRQMLMVGVQNPRVQNIGNQNGLIGVLGNANQNLNGNGNLVAARAEGNAARHNGNQIRSYNCRGVGHFARNCTLRPRRRDAAYLQTQLLIAQKEEAGIQLQAEEFDLMAAAIDLDEIEEVNANCILMANLQQASISGTQTDKAPVYDSDGSAEYTELLEPIPEQHQLPQNDNNVISEVTSMEQSGETLEQHPVNFEETQNKKLKSDFKTREDELLDKQIQLEKKIKELNNILVKTGQSIQTIHMLLPKPDLFYHTKQKMALGYENPFYLKQAQKKQQSLYDGKVLLEKHDPPVVHNCEETLQLAQESHEKMKQLNKKIKPTNYTKINHLLGVFVSQTAKSREELYFSNDSKMANVSKSVSIPNEEFSDDTTPSVARKFLNEEAARFVGDFNSLAKEADESLAKKKTLELEIERLLRAVVSQDIMSVVQKTSVVDTSNLQTELERTKERFENSYKDMQQQIEWLQAQLGDLKGKSKDTSGVSDTLNPLSQKLDNENVELVFQALNYARENAHLKATYKNLFDSISIKNTKFAKQSILGKPPMLGEIHALSKPVTANSVPTPQDSKVVNNDKVIAPGMFRINPYKTSREEKHVPNNVSASARTKPITVSQPFVITKKEVNSDSNGLSFIGIDNTKTRRPQPRSNTKNDRVPSASKSSRSKNKGAENVISKVVCTMCSQCLISINHDVCLRNYVNGKTSIGKKHNANVSIKEKQKKHQPKVKKPKKGGFIARLALPKPSKPRFLLRWSPTGRLFDQKGKIVDSSESKSQSDCSNGVTPPKWVAAEY